MRTTPNKTGKNVRPAKKYTQSRLAIGSSPSKFVKCPKCEMPYSPNSTRDIAAHKSFHDLVLKGRKWQKKWGVAVLPASNEITSSIHSSHITEGIFKVRPDNLQEVNAMMEIMTMVNNELHAPQDENTFWMEEDITGAAFVYVKGDRAVGAVTMEGLDDTRGRWMIYRSQKIVPKVLPKFELGISRIWVCRTQRGKNIATKLLEAARSNTIKNRVVSKQLVAWSQPTDAGGKLASKYNSVKHKSGELLLPCYI